MVRIAEVVPLVVFKNVVKDPNASPHRRKSVVRSVDIFTAYYALPFGAWSESTALYASSILKLHAITDRQASILYMIPWPYISGHGANDVT